MNEIREILEKYRFAPAGFSTKGENLDQKALSQAETAIRHACAKEILGLVGEEKDIIKAMAEDALAKRSAESSFVEAKTHNECRSVIEKWGGVE